MRRVLQLIMNAVAVSGLLIGALILLFNLVVSPAWQDVETGLFAANPVRWLLDAENSPLNQPRVLQTVCLWARLEPLPHSAQNIIVNSSGELFDKRYTVSFKANAGDIERWLAASAGTQSQIAQQQPMGDRHYIIQPRDAASAEVTVLADQQTVKIKAAWSSSG
ncbi:MAG: hypothetical protein WBA57_05095 [Elainellaceae cyanobacterium]